MDVLLVTYYGENSNYGAYYQALALSEYVKSLGNRAFFYGRKELDETGNGSTYGQKLQKHLEESRKVNFCVSYDENKVYDLAILGSDQIWCDKKAYFYGRGIRAAKIISYAPSIGNLISSNTKWKNAIKRIAGPLAFYKWKNDIRKLDGVSVRDYETYKLVKKTTGIEPEIVLDPTFLIDWNHFSADNPITEDYIVIYSYGLGIEQYKVIKKVALAKKCKIVALNHECTFSDYNADYSPEEVLSIFRDAKMVFTDTFHGTVFSLIFNRNVVVLKDSPVAKPYMLLKQLGIEDRCVTDSQAILECASRDIDYRCVNEQLSKAKEKSKAYLNRYFGGKNLR